MDNKPWLPYIVTDYIDKVLKYESVFEWGSGQSTLRLGKYISGEMVSIEHNRDWHIEMSKVIPSRVTYQFIPAEPGEIGPDKANPT